MLIFVIYIIFGVRGCILAEVSLKEDYLIEIDSQPYKFLNDYRYRNSNRKHNQCAILWA